MTSKECNAFFPRAMMILLGVLTLLPLMGAMLHYSFVYEEKEGGYSVRTPNITLHMITADPNSVQMWIQVPDGWRFDGVAKSKAGVEGIKLVPKTALNVYVSSTNKAHLKSCRHWKDTYKKMPFDDLTEKHSYCKRCRPDLAAK